MATPNMNFAHAGSDNNGPRIPNEGDGDDLLSQLKNSGDDPIIVTGSGPGQGTPETILLSRPEKMGWTIVMTGETTTVIIPKNALWQVNTDQASGKVYLERSGKVITKDQSDENLANSAQERAEKLAEMFQQWNQEEVDDSEALDDEFFKMLDDDRPAFRKLFPPELKGISW